MLLEWRPPTARRPKRWHRTHFALLAGLCGLTEAHAGRPFLTDDAGVIEHRQLQLETWLQFDRENADHSVALAYGAVDGLEVAAGVTYGLPYHAPRELGIVGPVLELKWMLAEPTARPGLALVFGTAPPWGRGHLEPPGWLGYGYAASSWQLLDERLSVLATAGAIASDGDGGVRAGPVLGLASAVSIVESAAVFAELFRGSLADARVTDITLQAGAYWSVTDAFQLDATVGTSLPVLTGSEARAYRFATLGIKLVSEPL